MPSGRLKILTMESKKNSHVYLICWVVALRAEAAPIIKIFNLQKIQTQTSFSVYANQELGHALIISGVGAIKSAAATSFLKAYLNIGSFAAWINLGIAGYHKEPIGKIYQAIKVSSQEHCRTFFPGFRFSKIIEHTSLLSVTKAELEYKKPALYDMEAFGFCEVASAFSCNELIFVFKIVSDTPKSSLENLTKSVIEDLVNNNLSTINQLLSEINKLSIIEMERLSIPQEVTELEDLIHFSKTNSNKFRNLYKKWKYVNSEKTLKGLHLSKKTAKEVIKFLEEDISSNKSTRDYL